MSEARPAMLPTRPAPRPASTRNRSSAADTDCSHPTETVRSDGVMKVLRVERSLLSLPDASGCTGTVSDVAVGAYRPAMALAAAARSGKSPDSAGYVLR